MIKLIVKYSYQKWTGSEYANKTGAIIVTVEKLESLTNNAIKKLIPETCFDIIDITQIV
ncbi:hypothetical protein [Thalassobellus citreus]|uniref:hypothetical protein n=1 Tax=Thalassobellus citreus TaxID=3367752 RepID=UPI0037BD9316